VGFRGGVTSCDQQRIIMLGNLIQPFDSRPVRYKYSQGVAYLNDINIIIKHEAVGSDCIYQVA